MKFNLFKSFVGGNSDPQLLLNEYKSNKGTKHDEYHKLLEQLNNLKRNYYHARFNQNKNLRNKLPKKKFSEDEIVVSGNRPNFKENTKFGRP